MNPTRRQVFAGVLATALLGGCATTDDSYDALGARFEVQPPPSKPVALTVTPIEGVTVTDQPLLSDSLVVTRDEKTITVIDIASGKKLWSDDDDAWEAGLPEGETFYGGEFALTRARKPLLLGLTYVNPCPGNASLCHVSQTDRIDGHNVLAIDARTKKVLWKAAAVPVVSRTDPSAAQWDRADVSVWGGTDDVVLLSVKLADGVRTVALDAATGKLRWQRDGMLPGHAGAGLLVCGVKWEPLGTRVGLSSFRVVDLGTGKDVAIAGRPSSDGTVFLRPAAHTTQDLVLFTETGDAGRAWALDLRRRRMVPGPHATQAAGRTADGKVLFVHGGRDGDNEPTLVTRAEGEAMSSVVRVGGSSSPTVDAVLDGTIWVSANGIGVVDRKGVQVADLWGRPSDARRPVSLIDGKLYRVT